MTIEFDCPDCGWHVSRYGEDAPPKASDPVLRCRACEWLASIDDPVERAEARQTTHLVWRASRS